MGYLFEPREKTYFKLLTSRAEKPFSAMSRWWQKVIFLTRQKKYFVGDCSILGGLYQQEPWVHWQWRGWSSSCSHPNLVPHDYSQFHSWWFLLRQTAAAKCQSTEENALRWARKLRERQIGWSLNFITSVWDRSNLGMWLGARCGTMKDVWHCWIYRNIEKYWDLLKNGELGWKPIFTLALLNDSLSLAEDIWQYSIYLEYWKWIWSETKDV